MILPIFAISFRCWETAATSASKESRCVLVYRVELLPEPRKTAEIWRKEAIKAGLGDLFLVNVQSSYLPQGTSPDTVGFDAAIRFEPRAHPTAPTIVRAWRTLRSPIHNDRFTRYEQIYRNWRDAPQPAVSPLRMRHADVGQHRTPAKKSWNHSRFHSGIV